MSQKVVEIFSSNDELVISRASDYLEEKGIKVLVRNKGTQDLIGLGRIGTSINPLVGEYELCVLEQDRDTGIHLLEDIFPELKHHTEVINEPSEKVFMREMENDHPPIPAQNFNARIGQCIVLNVLWLFGIGSLISLIMSFSFMKKRKVFFMVNTLFSIIGLAGAAVFIIYRYF